MIPAPTRLVFVCLVCIALNSSVISSAHAQGTLSGHVTVNFVFHSTGVDDGYWAADSIDNTLALAIPTVWDLTVKPTAIGPSALQWQDLSIWALPTLDMSTVTVGHSGNGFFTSSINQGNSTLDVLLEAQNTGPTEAAITYTRVDLFNIAPAGQPPNIGDTEEDSNHVSSKFNITIPAGANVIQPDGANAPISENITVQSGASLTTGAVSTVRNTLTNHGSGNFGGYVHGDFVNDALPASGNVANVSNFLDLYGQLQNTGQLQLTGTNGGLNLRSATSNAGTINLDSNGQIQILVSFNNSGTISLGGDFTYFGGAGTFTNNGTLQWSAGRVDNATFINNSIVNITGSGNHSAAAAITNNGTINQSNSQQITYSGGLTNSAGALYDITSDTFLNGTVANSGTFRKSGGTGSFGIEGAFTNSGTIAINTGVLSFDNGLNLATTSTLQFQLSGTTPASGFGNLNMVGAFTFAGALKVTLAPSFSPALGNSFDLFGWTNLGSANGSFASMQLPVLASGLKWDSSQLYTTGVLSIASGLPGDFNQNGVVDAPDYVLWRANLGAIYTQADFNTWRAHFGQTAGSGAGAIANAAVPEPTTLAMVVIGALAMCPLRRAGCVMNL
jgi:hypothetical protein